MLSVEILQLHFIMLLKKIDNEIDLLVEQVRQRSQRLLCEETFTILIRTIKK